MTQNKTQTIVIPNTRQNYPLMNAKSAPLTPRTSKSYTKADSTENPSFSTKRSTIRKKEISQRRTGGYHLLPASRTTLVMNPNFNEFTDPTELTLISKELKRQIIEARRELIPYKEEIRRLQYFYNPNAFDPTIKSMNERKNELETTKNEIDDQLNLNRRACQGSIYSSNELQNETLKQEFHERSIILERIEQRLDKKKEKLDQILNSQTASDIVDTRSKIKELTNKLKELKEEGENLYVQNLKQLSAVGSTQTAESQKLQPYKRKISEEQYNIEKKKGELRVMRNEHQKKVDQLKQSILQKREEEKRIRNRDTWRQRLNLCSKDNNNEEEEEEGEIENYDNIEEESENKNYENNEEEEEKVESESLNENNVHPPENSSSRSPRRNKLNGIIDNANTLIGNQNEEEGENENIENNHEEEEEECQNESDNKETNNEEEEKENGNGVNNEEEEKEDGNEGNNEEEGIIENENEQEEAKENENEEKKEDLTNSTTPDGNNANKNNENNALSGLIQNLSALHDDDQH